MIEVSPACFFAEGATRKCYIHPSNPDQVIKICNKIHDYDQNNRDRRYFKEYIYKKNIPTSHLSAYLGEVETNLGSGAIYDLALDYDGEISKSLDWVIDNNLLPMKKIKKHVNELQRYLWKYKIIFSDPNLHNIVCRKTTEGDLQLIVVDGLWISPKKGWKYKLAMRSDLYRRCFIIQRNKLLGLRVWRANKSRTNKHANNLT